MLNSGNESERYRKTMVIPKAVNVDILAQEKGILVPILTIVDKKFTKKRFKLEEENRKYTIGRDESCDFFVQHDSVSRHHARIWMERFDEQDPMVVIEDLFSTNKTLINGQAIQIARLNRGDKVFVGDIILIFEIMNSATLRLLEDAMAIAEKATIDSLTGLLSNRFFMESLPEIYQQAVKSDQPFSMIILDVDRFKAINDKFGHPTGDQALQIVAQVIRSSVRREDMPIRYGGDEIIIALPNTSLQSAVEVAERLRTGVEKYDCSTIIPGSKLSISIGVASRQNERDAQELMKTADLALYKAKRAGRNQVKTIFG